MHILASTRVSVPTGVLLENTCGVSLSHAPGLQYVLVGVASCGRIGVKFKFSCE